MGSASGPVSKKRLEGDRQHLIGSVAAEDPLRRQPVVAGHRLAEARRDVGSGYSRSPVRVEGLQQRADGLRRSVRILVGVQFDERPVTRLFPGDIRRERFGFLVP